MKLAHLRPSSVVFAIILLAAFVLVSTPGRAEQVIVKFAPGIAASEQVAAAEPGPLAKTFRLHKARLARKMGGNEKYTDLSRRIGLDRFWMVDVQDAAAFCAKMASLPDVQSARPATIARIALTPNDVYFPQQWALNNTGQSIGGTPGTPDADIDAPEAWNITTGSSSVTIAIIDTGVDIDHWDLAAKLVAGWDFYNNDSNPDDDHGHGTNCAGVAAALTNNTTGVSGVSWGARIMPLKVMSRYGEGPDSYCGDALKWAADHGAKIASLSLVLDGPSDYVADCVAYAIGAGVTVVAAMGNDNSGVERYPAASAGVIAVGATDNNDVRYYYSNYGGHIAVVAPGVQLYTTLTGGMYLGNFTGTSAATPVVAGVCALMLSLNPSLLPADLRTLVKQSADDKGARLWDDHYGSGRVNARRALQAVQDSTPPVILSIGAYAPISSTIRAAWNGQDLQSGIEYYEYRIGTSTGGCSAPASFYKNVGTATEEVRTDLSLNPSCDYYFKIRSVNGAGLWTEVTTQVIRTFPPSATISEAKSQPDGSVVTLPTRTVTAVFADGFYVEEDDRFSAIKVSSATSVAVGNRVNVTGILQLINGERVLRAATVQIVP